MREADDWRLTNQLDYLKKAKLKWQPYVPSSKANDHDHCEFCFTKFMGEESADAISFGYATSDRYRWVCQTCFHDFAELFEWQDEGAA